MIYTFTYGTPDGQTAVADARILASPAAADHHAGRLSADLKGRPITIRAGNLVWGERRADDNHD